MAIALNLPAPNAAPQPEVVLLTAEDRRHMEEICCQDPTAWLEAGDRARLAGWAFAALGAASFLYAGAYAAWLWIGWSGPRPHPLAPVGAVIGLAFFVGAVAFFQEARVAARNRLVAILHVTFQNKR